MQGRSLSDALVAQALRDGKRIREENYKYRVEWNRWTIIAALDRCCITLVTGWRE
jgi:hypothetical protein